MRSAGLKGAACLVLRATGASGTGTPLAETSMALLPAHQGSSGLSSRVRGLGSVAGLPWAAPGGRRAAPLLRAAGAHGAAGRSSSGVTARLHLGSHTALSPSAAAAALIHHRERSPPLFMPTTQHRPGSPVTTAAAAAYAASAGGDFRPDAAPLTGQSNPAPAATAEDDEDDGDELHAVETAIRANMLIFVAKLGVYFISSSSAMLAEAVHSLVDVANQMLLRIGIRKATKGPTKAHPFGYGRDQFVWPLISAVGIFCCGAGVSFIHGLQGLFDPHEIGPLFWNFVVLGVSLVLESHSMRVAVLALQKKAKKQGMTLWNYVKTGSDPAATAVMMEDGAAVAGLVIAAGCLGLCQVTGNPVWDSVGSLAVAGVLGAVAVVLIQRNRKWLIGKSMPPDSEQLLVDYLRRQPVVKSFKNVKTEEVGLRQYRFQAEVAFDGGELARRCLDRVGRRRLFAALAAASARRDAATMDALLMQFATVTVSAVGAEVDRMEKDMQRIVPGTRYVDIETDRGRPLHVENPADRLLRESAAAGGAAAAARSVEGAVWEGGGSGGDSGSGEWVRTDPGAEGDHLADLVYYPLGSLNSVDTEDSLDAWAARIDEATASSSRGDSPKGSPNGSISSGEGAVNGGGSGDLTPSSSSNSGEGAALKR